MPPALLSPFGLCLNPDLKDFKDGRNEGVLRVDTSIGSDEGNHKGRLWGCLLNLCDWVGDAGDAIIRSPSHPQMRPLLNVYTYSRTSSGVDKEALVWLNPLDPTNLNMSRSTISTTQMRAT